MGKLLTCGVMKNVMRGIPSCIKQESLNPMKAQVDTRGKSKTLVLKGDPKLNNVIEDSVYDTNPFHYISMVSQEFNWVVKEKY